MIYFSTYLIFIQTFIILTIEFSDLPPYFPRCHRLDPNLEDCWLRASNQTRQYIIKGIPEMNMPPMDPLKLPKISLEQGYNAVKARAELTNIEIKGLGSYVFNYYDFNVETLHVHIKGTIGKLELNGDYTISGQILIAPIEGHGKFSASIDDCNVEIWKKFKIIMKNNEEYLSSLSGNNITISVSKPKIHFDGLFDGNKEFGEITNRAIEDNIDEFFDELKPAVEKVASSIVDDLIFKNIEENVSYDKMYPNVP